MELIRIHATVSGRVQGVGFRYYTRKTAQEFDVTGWVMNRADGTVELEAQGEPAAITSFRQAVRRGPDYLGWVDNYREEDIPVIKGDKVFVIRY